MCYSRRFSGKNEALPEQVLLLLVSSFVLFFPCGGDGGCVLCFFEDSDDEKEQIHRQVLDRERDKALKIQRKRNRERDEKDMKVQQCFPARPPLIPLHAV